MIFFFCENAFLEILSIKPYSKVGLYELTGFIMNVKQGRRGNCVELWET